jgi:hypothetical protein
MTNLIDHDHCQACEETHDNCDCTGFAVIVNDELTEQAYVGIYLGYGDGLITIKCEGIDMHFAPSSCNMKREDNYE